MSTALIDHGRVKTTVAKAKSLSQVVEKLVTLAKRENLNARRQLTTHVGEKATKKLMGEIASANKTRPGGYTRIIRLGQRRSDGAEMAIIELTGAAPAPVTSAK
jgi:large subunit ribosomal protein L17